jgi:hypothetical protein
MEFITKDDNYLDRFKFYREEQKWYSFTILLQNDTVWYLENDEVIGKRIDFKPSNIFVTTKHETFWKIHKCKYLKSSSLLFVYWIKSKVGRLPSSTFCFI